ncbi:hypothetical protein E6C67_03880 (plasmid) [Azospirillum sp. TSA2s]|uniref:hypothetical protein n=1 Tax=Azospirillum sp. TSA2s TaxID=709810 RepID=UPI0010AAC36A|nr:hypothetical protein [Azospirillum sp. TSA2s]QCG93092.1 hypothetical protein E6C67_03880 [Azospirillum sp. TSA2s]
MLSLLDGIPTFGLGKALTILNSAQLQIGGAKPGGASTIAAPVLVFTGPRFDMTETLIGLIMLLVLTVAFFFGQRILTGMLIGGNARPQKAALAGWSLFLMLVVLTATAIFSVIGTLWTLLPVFGSLLGLNLILVILFVTSFVSAKRSARML